MQSWTPSLNPNSPTLLWSIFPPKILENDSVVHITMRGKNIVLLHFLAPPKLIRVSTIYSKEMGWTLSKLGLNNLANIIICELTLSIFFEIALNQIIKN